MTYRRRLDDTFSAFTRTSVPFAMVIWMVLARTDALEVKIYSLLPSGDKSHLLQLAHEARAKGMRVVFRTPAGTRAAPGVDAVEVL